MSKENPHTEQHIHPERGTELLQKLHLLLNAGRLCDVVLIAGKNKQRVPAHRLVLVASSPYFEAMFTGGMLESRSASEVMLGDDVHGDYLQPLVNFCYTGKIEICPNTVDELVLIASRLQLDTVVSACSAFMERCLEVSNCLGVAALAEILGLVELKQSADKYAQKQFVKVCRQEEFLRLNIDQLKVLIASDCLNVDTEEVVFRGVISWLNYSSEEEGTGTRSEHTQALLALVRLSHLPQSILMQQVRDLGQEHACLPLLSEALKEANVPIRSRRIKARKSMQFNLLAVWLDVREELLRIAEYSPEKDKWNLFDTTLPNRSYFGAAFFNNELIVAGGNIIEDIEYTNVRTNTVKSINLDTMALSEFPSMALERSNLGIAVLDGLLYAAGGVEFNVTLNRVDRYDPNDCKWSEVAPMSDARYNFGLAVLNGLLFAVGGRDIHSKASNSTECYDPQTNKWTMLANLNIPRKELCIASGNGFLYAVGGFDQNDEDEHLESIERYDPQADKWTEMCLSNCPRYCEGCVFLDDRLLILVDDGESTMLHEFDLLTESWTELATLEQRVCYLRAVKVEKRKDF